MTATSGAYASTSTLNRISDGCSDECQGTWPGGRTFHVRDCPNDRPRCSDGDRRKRTEQVLVRLTPDELADARRLAAEHHLSVPELLRAGLTLLTATEAPR